MQTAVRLLAKSCGNTRVKEQKIERDIAYYVIGNYVSKQPIERISYSQKWVCKGFSKKWKIFLEVYGKRAVEVRDKWLFNAEFHCNSKTKLFVLLGDS